MKEKHRSKIKYKKQAAKMTEIIDYPRVPKAN